MGNNPFQIKPSMPYIGQIYTPPEKVQIGGAGVQGGGKVGGTQGGMSAVDRDLADLRSFLPAYNGTGELRPNNAEEGATLKMLYA